MVGFPFCKPYLAAESETKIPAIICSYWRVVAAQIFQIAMLSAVLNYMQIVALCCSLSLGHICSPGVSHYSF